MHFRCQGETRACSPSSGLPRIPVHARPAQDLDEAPARRGIRPWRLVSMTSCKGQSYTTAITKDTAQLLLLLLSKTTPSVTHTHYARSAPLHHLRNHNSVSTRRANDQTALSYEDTVEKEGHTSGGEAPKDLSCYIKIDVDDSHLTLRSEVLKIKDSSLGAESLGLDTHVSFRACHILKKKLRTIFVAATHCCAPLKGGREQLACKI